MREHPHRRMAARLLILAVVDVLASNAARGQTVSIPETASLPEKPAIHRVLSQTANLCEQTAKPSPLNTAFRQVCLRDRMAPASPLIRKAVIIGFVGGFVKHDDPKHPEVQFAAYLRDRYPAGIHAEVFANHQGQKALREVLRVLDSDGDGVLSATEKEQASIIIYGHSWGASQTITLARELGQRGIPVLLTIQLDTIGKPGQNSSTIPPNVVHAINFYQPRGILHGHPEILAADPTRTEILGNFRMTYEGHPINCSNYPWLARVFNKPHHEIENDPRVWDRVASLIESELSSPRSTAEASSSPKLPPF
jgi:hypothetical protein